MTNKFEETKVKKTNQISHFYNSLNLPTIAQNKTVANLIWIFTLQIHRNFSFRQLHKFSLQLNIPKNETNYHSLHCHNFTKSILEKLNVQVFYHFLHLQFMYQKFTLVHTTFAVVKICDQLTSKLNR